MVQEVMGSNPGLDQLITGKPSLYLFQIREEYSSKRRKLGFAFHMLRPNFIVSNPHCPFSHKVMGNLYLFS